MNLTAEMQQEICDGLRAEWQAGQWDEAYASLEAEASTATNVELRNAIAEAIFAASVFTDALAKRIGEDVDGMTTEVQP